jgi:hypothetical protein
MLTQEELMAQIIALKAENDALKSHKKDRILTWKVSAKGGVSIYGLGKFPVTLYYSQLIKLANEMPNIVKFAEENKASLAVKEKVVLKVAA